MTAFCSVAPCRLIDIDHCFWGNCFLRLQGIVIALDVGGSKHLWNVSQFLPDCMLQRPRRQLCSCSPQDSYIHAHHKTVIFMRTRELTSTLVMWNFVRNCIKWSVNAGTVNWGSLYLIHWEGYILSLSMAVFADVEDCSTLFDKCSGYCSTAVSEEINKHSVLRFACVIHITFSFCLIFYITFLVWNNYI
jgi:hypothetical protein